MCWSKLILLDKRLLNFFGVNPAPAFNQHVHKAYILCVLFWFVWLYYILTKIHLCRVPFWQMSQWNPFLLRTILYERTSRLQYGLTWIARFKMQIVLRKPSFTYVHWFMALFSFNNYLVPSLSYFGTLVYSKQLVRVVWKYLLHSAPVFKTKFFQPFIFRNRNYWYTHVFCANSMPLMKYLDGLLCPAH